MKLTMLSEGALEILTTNSIAVLITLLKSNNVWNYGQINFWVNLTWFHRLILLSIKEVED